MIYNVSLLMYKLLTMDILTCIRYSCIYGSYTFCYMLFPLRDFGGRAEIIDNEIIKLLPKQKLERNNYITLLVRLRLAVWATRLKAQHFSEVLDNLLRPNSYT